MAIFFPPKGASLLPAYSICIVCPVRLKCLESLLVEPFGVIAGFSERERKVIAKRVREGMSLEEAIKPEDARKARKLHSAALRDSPALYHKGTRISIEDLPIPQA